MPFGVMGSSGPTGKSGYKSAVPNGKIDVSEDLLRMMTAIDKGDVEEYKDIIHNQFPVKLRVRDGEYVHPMLTDYIHPDDGSDYKYLTPLQLAVYSGNPDMVMEVLKLGNYLEHQSIYVAFPEFKEKTARGIADLMIEKSETPDQVERFKLIKKILLQNGAKPKMVTSITGKRLAFPENKANMNVYAMSIKNSRKSRKTRNTRKTRKTRKTSKSRKVRKLRV